MSCENNELPLEEPVAEQPGTPAEVTAAEPETAPEAPKPHKKPHIALRIAMQILSLVLSVALFGSAIAGVALADLNRMTSAGGMKQLISAILMPTSGTPAVTKSVQNPENVYLASLSCGVVTCDSTDSTGNGLESGDIDLSDIPDDILTGGGSEENVNALVDWLYDQFNASSESGLEITREQMESFVEKSTVSDYLSEKLADYADDFINGTENAQITTEELMGLLEENEALLKSELQIELTPEQKDSLNAAFHEMVVEQDLNGMIREKVNSAVDAVLEQNAAALGGMDREGLQQMLQLLTSTGLLLGVLGGCVVLLLLLCAANFYNVPAGLTWGAVSLILAGSLVSLPIAALQGSADLLLSAMPEAASVAQLLSSFAGLFAPIHYGVLALGIVLLVGSIVWRIVRASLRRKHAAATAA